MENGELNMHLCRFLVSLYHSHIPPYHTHTATASQRQPGWNATVSSQMKNEGKVESGKKELSKWQMLHIAKLDIIEFNVVKWFCSGEYIKHISIRIWKRGREREKKETAARASYVARECEMQGAYPNQNWMTKTCLFRKLWVRVMHFETENGNNGRNIIIQLYLIFPLSLYEMRREEKNRRRIVSHALFLSLSVAQNGKVFNKICSTVEKAAISSNRIHRVPLEQLSHENASWSVCGTALNH